MLKNIEIHNMPTSKLIYYRVYRTESPFSLKKIDGELKRRKNVLFDSCPSVENATSFETFQEDRKKWEGEYLKYNENHRLEKIICPKYIHLLEEETKFEQRGQGLDKYFFDEGKDFYTTFIGMFEAVEKNCGKKVSFNSYACHQSFLSTLTWSEQILLLKIAKKMQQVMIEKDEKLDELWWEIPYECRWGNFNIPTKELELYNFFIWYPFHFFRQIYILYMNKCVLDNIGILGLDIFSKSFLLKIKGYFLPSFNYVTIYDKMRLFRDIKKEKRYIKGAVDDILDDSMIQLLKEDGKINSILEKKLKNKMKQEKDNS